jgi:hypothetical protein
MTTERDKRRDKIIEAIARLPTDRKIMRVYHDPVNLPLHSVRAIVVKHSQGIAISSEVLVLGQYATAAETEDVAVGVRRHLAVIEKLTT